MAEKFVSVQQVTGQAWVRFDGGQLVLLREGMRIPEDAIITTAGNGAVQLVNEQGEVFAVTANQELPLNEASFQGGSGSTADVTAHNDQSTLIAALKDEQDPFAVLEDTESILNGGETAGGSFVRLDSIIERTSPMDLEYPKPSQVRDDVRRPNGVASGGEEPKQPGDIVPPEPETPSTKPSILSHEAKVFEAGLDAGGTEAATDKEFASGVFTFKSPDGVGSINFAGVTLAQGVDKTFVVQTQDIKGVITAQYTFNESTKTGEIRYTFELSEHTEDVANQQELLQLAVVLTDSDGDSAMGSVTIEVIDDAPIAHADTGTLQDGVSTLTVDAAGGVLANDQAGADGWGKVIGVEAGAHTTTTATGVGATITGSYGTLTLLADGSYTYERMPDASGSDVFTYTVVDRDGSLSLSTLTIGIDGVPTIDPVQGNPATGHDATTVWESGLAAGGTEAATDKEFASGVFTFKSPDGVGSITLGGTTLTLGVDKTFAVDSQGIKGLVTAQYTFNESTKTGEIHYTFELRERTDDVAGQPEVLPLPVVVTDRDGDTATGRVTIEVIDDTPIAVADTGEVTEGATLIVAASEGVLSNDAAGADAWATGGGVIGVQAGSSTTPSTEGVGAEIAGMYGTLTLYADGSYSYTNHGPEFALFLGYEGGHWQLVETPLFGDDVFTYTVLDGDGDVYLATLTISSDGTPSIGPVQSVPSSGLDATTVYESGLNAAGSEAETDKEFAQGVMQFLSRDKVGSITLGGHTLLQDSATSFDVEAQGIKGLVTAHYTFNESTKTGEIHYTFELTERTDDVANQQELLPLEVVLVDADGDKATSTLSIEVIDDSPVTSADMGNVTEGVVLTVTAADGVLSNDQAGADHWNSAGGVVGVSAGGKLGILNGSGFEIQGLYGKLTLNIDGSYTYAARTLPNAQTLGEAQESFTYTVRDGDGDEKTATLVIDVNQFAAAGNENNNITGGYGNDVLVGDVGGQQWVDVPGENYNIAMIIDNSTSMTELWEGRSRGDISKETVKFFVENHLLTHDGDINLSLIDFHGVVRASVIGLNASNYLEMIDAIDNIAFNVQNTPYGRGFDTAKAWFETEDVALSHNAGYKNITYLLTDGDPIGEGLDKRVEAFEALNEVSYVNLIGIGDIRDEYYVGQFDSGTQLSHHSTAVDFSAMSENDVKNWRFIGNPNDLYVGNVLVSDYYKSAMISWVNSGSSMKLQQPDSIFITDASGGYLTFLTSASTASIEAVWSLERFDGATWVVVESHQVEPSVGAYSSHLTQLHPPGEYRFKFDITSSNAAYKSFLFSSIELLSGDYVPGIDIVKNPEDLIDTFIEGYKRSVPVAVGDDVLSGGFGDDVLFGDAINTDHLMWSGRNDYPEGSGLAALKAFLADTLYQGVMPTDSQIHQYLVAHHEDFNNENSLDARGGNDQLSGGAGNDVLYGQVGDDLLDGGDGNDILYGGLGSDQLIGGAGDDVLRGGAGNDQLHGGSGNDVIHGGQGDDILVGGDGDDIFVWDANDQGGVSNPAYDVIKDFSLSSNDVLDFSDLLNNQFGDDLTSFLYFEKSGDDTVIKISADGGLSNNGVAFDQQITLENVDFSAYGNMDDQAALIQTLIEQGKIIVD